MIQLHHEYVPTEVKISDYQIFLIDDDPVFSNILCEAAQESFCNLEFICSPFELEYAASDTYDLILLDFQLGPTNGLNIVPSIAENFPRTPIVLISSNRDISELELTIPEIYDFLIKSESPHDILRRSKELIDQLNMKH